MDPLPTRAKFELAAIPRYFWHGPARIRAELAGQGPVAASLAARRYSLALFVVVVLTYFLAGVQAGLVGIPLTAAGAINLADPRAVVFAILCGSGTVLTLLADLWAVGLALVGLFTQGGERSQSFMALVWSQALAVFYGGFASGLFGF